MSAAELYPTLFLVLYENLVYYRVLLLKNGWKSLKIMKSIVQAERHKSEILIVELFLSIVDKKVGIVHKVIELVEVVK